MEILSGRSKNALPRSLFFVCLIVLALHTGRASADERILEMNVSADVGRDAAVTVREEIKFRAEGREFWHGIIRSIPTDYTGTDGKSQSTVFRLVSVLMDGHTTGADETRRGGSVEIRIGNPDAALSHGVHTILLTYSTIGWIAFRESFDELYWNVTGTDWRVPIDRASFALTLPEGASVSQRTAFTGKSGAAGNAFRITGDSVETTRGFAPGEGLTVAFAWNKGVVVQPEEIRRSAASALFTSGSTLFFILAAFIVMYYFAAWYTIGRDPEPSGVIPLYRPPSGVGPGYARYLRDMKFSHEVLAADLIYLAVLGFITLTDEEPGLRIKLTKKALGDEGSNNLRELSEPLRVIISAISKNHTESGISVTETYGDVFISAEDSLRRVYEAEGKNQFNLNTGFSIAGLILFLPFIFLAPWTWPRLLAAARTMLFSVPAGGIFWMRLSAMLARFSSWMSKTLLMIMGTLLAVASLFALVDMFETDMYAMAALLVATCAALFFSRIMSARTVRGMRTMAEINGLAMYMNTAERHRLAMINPPDETPKLFETLLPYAFALDCAETWADSFADVLKRASYKPSWDSSGGWDSARPWRYSHGLYGGIGRSVDKSIKDYKTAMAAEKASRSSYDGGSGFGGGGSVGGGGGGGGGRGW
ncbi:MAG: DUF2207 domain-containing protein [Synergistaceae bacterium]|nr:DUF2207 domain-containing protein [Synergistaceae bacterium]